MRELLIFALMISVQFGACMEISEVFDSIDKQGQAVVSLLSEVRDLSKQKGVSFQSPIMDRYSDVFKKTIKMVEDTKKVLDSPASGCREMMLDVVTDDTDMLYCSMINNVEKMIELNELLQQHVDFNFKKRLNEQLQEIREKLNN